MAFQYPLTYILIINFQITNFDCRISKGHLSNEKTYYLREDKTEKPHNNKKKL